MSKYASTILGVCQPKNRYVTFDSANDAPLRATLTTCGFCSPKVELHTISVSVRLWGTPSWTYGPNLQRAILRFFSLLLDILSNPIPVTVTIVLPAAGPTVGETE